ncbi:hypothetical protein Daura_37475 [Dactylosporangium aurantiacum]|uniref:Uncharacterized protein n=1 Tax=Dactylosporangium aurantiacum TaxID=35754 RepID=A0A9Q9IBW2_9ACTN|nr:hypothetical protein [Dactylosporangium aurantiacum]MDG6101891.1 hypothetical protein [Dactylosporangium aurantiacum]UWZ52311.1 hypothetical protein Daura_37475 [Dactylosporangium aurantiacum]
MTLAQHAEQQADTPPDGRPSGASRTAVWRSGWWPAALVAVCAVALLWCYDVPPATTGVFAAYVALAVTVPGMLLWRLVHRGSRTLPEDLAAGTAIGYGIEVLAYIPARAAGMPLAAQAVPVLIIAAFAAVPGLRRYWRGDGAAGRVPLAWSWTLAVVALIMLAWASKYYRYLGQSWPSYGRTDIDLPFHLALTGEFKHHMDLVTPWVTSEGVYYHWFIYADFASTSWVTGIEPWTLISRLSLLPMIMAYVVLVAAFGRRATGSWLGGALTALAAFLILSPDPYGWPLDGFYTSYAFNTMDDGSNLKLFLWSSPSQTFGSMLFVPLMLLLLDLLRDHGGDRRRWVLFALLPAAIMGAKATFLPTLLCGLLLVVCAQLLFRRRLNRVALAALGVVAAWMLFAQFVLFGGESQGLDIVALGGMRHNPVGDTTNYISDPKLYRLAILLGLTALCWVCMWAGAVGLRRHVLDADVLVMAGLGIVGMSALLLFAHSGGSAEGFFLMGARPYLATLAVWGLLLLAPALTWRRARPLLLSLLAGMAVIWTIRALDGDKVPMFSATYRTLKLTTKITYPYAILALLAVATAVVAWRYRARLGTIRPAALAVALMLGFSLPTAISQISALYPDGRDYGWKDRADLWPIVTEGTVEAGRWLRARSTADDLIATNAHCVYLSPADGCDRRHFGIAAYSERRVLVESWAYTAEAHSQEQSQGVIQQYTMYWHPQTIIDNDAAFTDPSPQTVGRLRDQYGVRWLWVEDVSNWYWTEEPPYPDEVHVSPDLGKFTTLRYRAGHVAIYEIT